MATITAAQFNEMSTWDLYGILRLRTDVFVVEQKCPYPELDGRDTEPETRHVWAADSGRVVAYLRVTGEPGGRRIGRVCTAVPARGRGLAGRLMDAALAHIGDAPVWMHAQVSVVPFYERYGFAVAGPEFSEDDIPHVLMRRARTLPPPGGPSASGTRR